MIEEMITLMIMATALGMDAFSIALGMGMLGLRVRQIFNIGVTVGLFHVIMPLIGIIFGKMISSYFGDIAIILGGGLLLVIGGQMAISAIKSVNSVDERADTLLKPVGFGLILFALSVSLDSFSAGLSLGMLGAKTAITLIAFGLISMVLSWVGLVLGSKLKHFVGAYGECIGGFILIVFGLKLILPI